MIYYNKSGNLGAKMLSGILKDPEKIQEEEFFTEGLTVELIDQRQKLGKD